MKNIFLIGACLAMSLSASACVTTSVTAKVTIVDDVGIEFAMAEQKLHAMVISQPYTMSEGYTLEPLTAIGSGWDWADLSVMSATVEVAFHEVRPERSSYLIPLTIGKADTRAKNTICKRARDGLTNS